MEAKCPRCGGPTKVTPENPYRPFCSERCKMIDLGNWAEGKYAIPVENKSEAEDPEHDESQDDDGDESLRH
ncbi:MAG: DNA gyrase inhibitor YacG [Bdellovibrionota bacterium]